MSDQKSKIKLFADEHGKVAFQSNDVDLIAVYLEVDELRTFAASLLGAAFLMETGAAPAMEEFEKLVKSTSTPKDSGIA